MKLGDLLDADLSIFQKLNYGCSKIAIIREAVAEYIKSQLAQNPLLKMRFDAEKAARSAPNKVVNLAEYRARRQSER